MFPEDKHLVFSFSLRRHENLSLCYGDTSNSLAQRRSFLAELGVDYRNLICAKQVHSSNIRYVKEEDTGRGALTYESAFADTDGFITDRKNVPLAVFTADCLSVFLYDPSISAIGLVHAGWRSSKEEIAAKSVNLFLKKFNARPQNIRIVFGPCIRDCCYSIGDDLKGHFSYGLEEREGRYYLDLAGINKKQLLDCGIPQVNICDSKICTSCQNQDFYSYRKEGESAGRMMSVIMLK